MFIITLHRTSECLFFLLGSAVIVCLILLKQGVQIALLQPILNSLDLPLLLIGCMYAGLSLYRSIRRERGFSLLVALCIGIPLLCVFGTFAYINFFLPVVVNP